MLTEISRNGPGVQGYVGKRIGGPGMAGVVQQGSRAPVRRSFVFRGAPWLRDAGSEIGQAYLARRLDALSQALIRALRLPPQDPATGQPALQVTHLPLRDWDVVLRDDPTTEAALKAARRPATDAAIALRFPSLAAERAFRAAAGPVLGPCDPVVGDVRLGDALHWCPGRGEGDTFGTLADAHRLVRASALAEARLDGEGVNVVIVDQGIDAARLPRDARLRGGWWKHGATRPGAAEKDTQHGTMVARNVLAIAPRATIWDCPLIPPRIRSNLPAFLSDAFGALVRMAEDIALLKALRPEAFGGHWVFVNAWSIYDRRGEAEEGDCTGQHGHCVACAVEEAAALADLVFAAGNCGAFCPDGRCADDVIGPGRSILGVNSLPGVLTVGAVRTDGIWAGYSSQGPGQFPDDAGRPQEKPDIAAPSSFRMPDTAHRRAGGSSAACAVAAGVVAALRTEGRGTGMPPPDLFDLLRRTARRGEGEGWNARTGYGVLDCARLLGALGTERAA